MSITSCPRCAGQVSLPLGISNDATVRCPLCHAQYTLSDALASLPPSLEVVEAAPDADAPAVDDIPLVAGAMPVDELAATPAAEDDLIDDLELPAEEAGDDDLTAEGQDTEVEELSFSTFEADPAEPPSAEPAAKPLASGAQEDDLALDFGEELSAEASEADTLEMSSAPLGELPDDAGDDIEFDLDASAEPGDDEGATLEFSEEPDEADDEVKFDLDAPAETEAGDDATIEFDNSEGIRFEPDAQEAAAGAPAELQEFGDFQVEPTGEAEDIPLDTPDEAASEPVAGDDEEEPTGKKKKKKKKKATAANGKPKGSALVRFGLPLTIAVPLALYGAMWAGYDLVGLKSYLPAALAPADTKPTRGGLAYSSGRPATPPGISDTAPGLGESLDDPSSDTPPAEEMPADEPPALAPSDEPLPTDEAAMPPADSAELDPAEPADDPLATPVAAEEMPAADAAAPDDNPFGQPPALTEPDENPFGPADAAPETTPAADADAPDDNPFGQPAAPTEPDENPFGPADAAPETTPAEAAADSDPLTLPATPEMPVDEPALELPTEPEAKPEMPADDANPFGTPAADTGPEPAAEDPFAPSAIETPPADSEPLPAPADPAQPVELLGPRDTAEVSPAEVVQALEATMAANQQMTAAEVSGDTAALRKARANFYITLFNMADAVTLGKMGPGAAQLDPQMRALEPIIRQQLASDPKKFESLKVFGARWFAFPKRTTNGVVVAGTVVSVDQAGKLYHARVRPGDDGAPAVTIVSAKDPQLAAGDEVLALGSIVENPTDQVAGYEGSEPAVVWSGMTLKIPPSGS